MKTQARTLVLALAAAALAAGAQAAPRDAGQRIVTRNCAQCHAVGLKGASPNAAAPAFRDLSDRYPIEMLEEALAEGMLTAHRAMPQFKFSPSEIEAIVAYLESIQTTKVSAALHAPGSAKRAGSL